MPSGGRNQACLTRATASPPRPSSSTSCQKSLSYWVSGMRDLLADVMVMARPAREFQFLGVDVEPVDVVEDAFGVVDDAAHRGGVAVA